VVCENVLETRPAVWTLIYHNIFNHRSQKHQDPDEVSLHHILVLTVAPEQNFGCSGEVVSFCCTCTLGHVMIYEYQGKFNKVFVGVTEYFKMGNRQWFVNVEHQLMGRWHVEKTA
jgi:hypothetical protein